MAADGLREGCLSACQSWAVSRTKAGRESWQGERAVLCPSLLLQLQQKCSQMWGAASLRWAASGRMCGSFFLAEEDSLSAKQAGGPGLGETDQGTDAALLQLCWLGHRTCEQVLDQVPAQGSYTPGTPIFPHGATQNQELPFSWEQGVAAATSPAQACHLPSSCILGGPLETTSTPTRTHPGRRGQERVREGLGGLNKTPLEQSLTTGNSFWLEEKPKAKTGILTSV